MTTLVIEQPNYVPWLGYFDLMNQSDLWVWLDDVQYTQRDWRNRNRISGPEGPTVWLSIPVRTRGRRAQQIREVEIDYEQPWIRKHLRALAHCYSRAPHFELVHGLLAGQLERRPPLLADLTIPLCEEVARLLGVETRFRRSSELGVSGAKQERLLGIQACVGGDVYLSGPAAEEYIDPAGFSAAGVELRYIEYRYGPYARGTNPFVPALSILDPLCWVGPDETAACWLSSSSSRPG